MGGAYFYRDILPRFKTVRRTEAELSKCSWYPKRKLRVTMHFSEIFRLQFGKEYHTLLCILKLFTNIVD